MGHSMCADCHKSTAVKEPHRAQTCVPAVAEAAVAESAAANRERWLHGRHTPQKVKHDQAEILSGLRRHPAVLSGICCHSSAA